MLCKGTLASQIIFADFQFLYGIYSIVLSCVQYPSARTVPQSLELTSATVAPVPALLQAGRLHLWCSEQPLASPPYAVPRSAMHKMLALMARQLSFSTTVSFSSQLLERQSR